MDLKTDSTDGPSDEPTSKAHNRRGSSLRNSVRFLVRFLVFLRVRLWLPIVISPLLWAAYALCERWATCKPFWNSFWSGDDEVFKWLAVSAIFYAFFHEFELMTQATHLGKQVESLRELEKGLATSRLPFPQYLVEVRRIAENSNDLPPENSTT